jgi:hypothetical protein
VQIFMEFANTIPGADVTNLAYSASQIIRPNDLPARERDVHLVLNSGKPSRVAIRFLTWKHCGEVTDELSEPPQFLSLKPALGLGPSTRWTRNKRPDQGLAPTPSDKQSGSISPSRVSGGGRSGDAAKRIASRGPGSRSWPMIGSPNPASFIPGQAIASPSTTRGGSRMRESPGTLTNRARPGRWRYGTPPVPADADSGMVPKKGSQLTRRWRGMDSNFQFRAR